LHGEGKKRISSAYLFQRRGGKGPDLNFYVLFRKKTIISWESLLLLLDEGEGRSFLLVYIEGTNSPIDEPNWKKAL